MSPVAHTTLAVLGGSSPATPVLIAALRRAQAAGRLGTIELRLYGRNLTRLQRICDYASASAGAGQQPSLSLAACEDLAGALHGATHILCMVRPGGMSGRADDELLARRANAVADEGLGVGGMRCYLRGRELIESLAQACARHAPRAYLLQMSSPLGLNVALSRRALGERVVGVCELPRTTAKRLGTMVDAVSGLRWSSHSHAGLNHQSWLYAFRDARGHDITAQVLAALPADAGLGVTTAKIRELGAVPVHYLRMYFHPRRAKAEQQGTRLRGHVLADWAGRVELALCEGNSPDSPRVDQLLGERRMDWFDEGVVPVLEALQQSQPGAFTLNVPAAAAMPDAPADAIVEIDCSVSISGVQPKPVPPLPAGPAALTRVLLGFERAALDLPRSPTASMLADVLATHPLAPRRKLGDLSRALAAVRAEPACA